MCFEAAMFIFLIRARNVRSASSRSGTEILEVWDSYILGGSNRPPKIIKWQGMKLLTFFVASPCQLGGTEIRCEEETGSQNVGFVTCVQIALAKSFKMWSDKIWFPFKNIKYFSECNLKEIQLRLVSWFSRSIGVSHVSLLTIITNGSDHFSNSKLYRNVSPN